MIKTGPIVIAAILASSLAQAATTSSAVISSVRLGRTADYTRIVFDLSQPVEHETLLAEDGSSLQLELYNVVPETDVTRLELGKTPIEDVLASLDGDNNLHLRLAFNEPIRVESLLLRPYLQRGYRLALDIYPEVDVASAGGSAPGHIATVPPERLEDKPGHMQGSMAGERSAGGSGATREESGRWALSGTAELEWAFETDSGSSQKFEALIEPRLDAAISDSINLTGILRLRADGVGDIGPDASRPDNYSAINGPLHNSAHSELSVRELYLDGGSDNLYWRVGKQQVVWGQADGIKVLDVVNPQSYREFILDEFNDSRIPLTMVNLEFPIGMDSSLQVLWIPDTTYHELAEADTPYAISSPLLVPVAPPGLEVDVAAVDKPDHWWRDSDAGMSFTSHMAGWDISLNYLYHYQDFPVLYQDLELQAGQPLGLVSPEYERSHLLGGTLSNSFGELVLRAELAYNSDTYHVSRDLSRRGIGNSAEFASVVGLDWQLGGYDSLLSFQWFQSHLLDYDSAIRRDATEHNLSFLLRRDFANETWIFDALALYSTNRQDSQLQLRLKHLWRSNIELWVGGDIFSGDSEGIYGQFRDRDRILVGAEIGF